MRTLTDLRGAFALLENDADAYAAHDEIDAAEQPSRVFEHAAGRRAGPRHHVGNALSAAALVTALTAGVLVWTSRDEGATPPGGDPDAPVPTSLPFRIGDADLEITAANAAPGIVQVHLSDHGAGLEMNVYSAGAAYGESQFPVLQDAGAGEPLPGLTRHDVAGHLGYYGTFGDMSRVTPGTVDEIARHDLAWRYAPDSWVVLYRTTRPVADAEFFRVAESIDFDGRTALRFPVALDAAPPGSRLHGWDTSYRLGASPIAFYEPIAPSGDGKHIVINASRVPGVPYPGEPVQVGERTGSWSADDHLLTVVLGTGVTVQVRGASGTDATSVTEDQAVAIAAGITFAPDFGDPDTWFDVADALP